MEIYLCSILALLRFQWLGFEPECKLIRRRSFEEYLFLALAELIQFYNDSVHLERQISKCRLHFGNTISKQIEVLIFYKCIARLC